MFKFMFMLQVRFSLKGMEYLIFSILRSDNEVKNPLKYIPKQCNRLYLLVTIKVILNFFSAKLRIDCTHAIINQHQSSNWESKISNKFYPFFQAYVSSSSLTEHTRFVHEGYKRPKKYPCPMCDRVFDVSIYIIKKNLLHVFPIKQVTSCFFPHGYC